MNNEDYLRHYGIRGMKWRMSKAPTKQETRDAEALARMWDDPSGSLPTHNEHGKLIYTDKFTKKGKLISRTKYDAEGKISEIQVNHINKGRDIVDKMLSGKFGKGKK